jgi:hypothetical protein
VRDLATVHRGAVNVFVGRGDGTFVQSGIRYGTGDGEALTMAPGHRIAAGDVSGDGANDLAVASARTYFSFVVLLHGRFQSPNAVELSAFEAQPVAEGILVSWSTGFASDHAGFHVHRSTRSDGARERLTPKLILPDEPYRFLDRVVN